MNTITLQELFEGKIFEIPDYQRGYSWESEHISDLLEDLDSIVNNNHYTGTLVIKKIDENVSSYGYNYNKFELVDGQQRITTLTILLNEIINELHDYANKTNDSGISFTANTLKEKYIFQKNPQGGIFKLELEGDNKYFFHNKILNETSIMVKTQSQQLLINGKKQIKEYFIQRREKENYLDLLYELTQKITQELKFILYEVEDDAQVGIIFEVMNNRGKPLSYLEIIKNFLIYQTEKVSKNKQTEKQLIHDINYSWKEILENLSASDWTSQDEENRFLRMNYILNYYSEIKTYNDLEGNRVSINSQLSEVHKSLKKKFKTIGKKDKITCYNGIKKYVNSLRTTSYRLKDLIKPFEEDSFQNIKKYKNDVREVAAKFNRLEVRSNILPLLISIYDVYEKEPVKLLKLMKKCEKALFRVYYIADKRSYAGQTKFYALSNEVYTKKTKKCEDVLKQIINITEDYCPNNKILELILDGTNYYEWAGIEYFLYEYETERCLESTPEKKPHFFWEEFTKNLKKDSIEHILPQTIETKKGPIKYWTSRFNKEEHEDFVHKLGNLTLSSRSLNSKLGNKKYPEKKEIYTRSLWQMQRDLPKQYNHWNKSNIEKREQELANFTFERWGN